MILAATVLASLCAPALAARPDFTLDRVLEAIRIVETGGTPDCGRTSDGDGGRAIGPFQIHWPYWKDAGLAGKYEDCRDIVYARRVVLSYWRRYCPQALENLDAEVLARTHNGGPSGAKRGSTIPFWNKVRRELERPSTMLDPCSRSEATNIRSEATTLRWTEATPALRSAATSAR